MTCEHSEASQRVYAAIALVLDGSAKDAEEVLAPLGDARLIGALLVAVGELLSFITDDPAGAARIAAAHYAEHGIECLVCSRSA